MSTVLATQLYSAGAHVIAPTAIPNALTSLDIAILRCTSADPSIWPLSTDTITFSLLVSVNGASYQTWADGNDNGGIVVNGKTGIELATMDFGGTLPPGINRLFKGIITLSATIKTGASVTVS